MTTLIRHWPNHLTVRSKSIGPFSVTCIPSWATYPLGPSFWRAKGTLCARWHVYVFNIRVKP